MKSYIKRTKNDLESEDCLVETRFPRVGVSILFQILFSHDRLLLSVRGSRGQNARDL
jgi:hypothetical protein